MNQSIELHDSVIAEIKVENGVARILFSHAYVHRSEGEPGRDAGTGWTQKVELLIHDASNNDLSAAFPWIIYDGQIEFGGTALRIKIPIPFDVEGIVNLKLDVLDDEENVLKIEISGVGARLIPVGEACYVEDFPGASGNFWQDK